MRGFRKRLAIALTTGYVFFFYGELVFWATPDRPGMGVAELLLTWLVYSVFAYVFLCVVSVFKARSLWSVFLAGAFFGWYEEGVVMGTTYGTPDTPFPISISFSGLAWHALIDVLIGWHLVRKALARSRLLDVLTLACGIGAFYGLWAVFWWTEPPAPMQALFEAKRKDLVLLHFAVFSLATTVLLIAAHALYARVSSSGFKPTKIELWILGIGSLLYFAFVTVPAAPRALIILPVLMGPTLWALNRNRRTETRPDAIVAFAGRVKWRRYLCLLAIPLVASVVYFVALACDAFLRTNVPIYYLTSAVGLGLWIFSIIMTFQSRAHA